MTIAGTIRRELPNALFCLVCVWLIVAGLPYWFGQAFAYSGTLDRTEAAAKAAEATFGCHAHIAAVSMTLIGIVSMCARAIHLKKASGGVPSRVGGVRWSNMRLPRLDRGRFLLPPGGTWAFGSLLPFLAKCFCRL